MSNPGFLSLLLIICAVGVSSAIGDHAKIWEGQVSASQAQTPAFVEADPKSWQEFSSEAGGFRVMFPGAPVEEDNSSGTLPGRKFLVKTNAYYLVAYHEFPEKVAAELAKRPELRKQLFDKVRDNASSAKTKLLEDTDISINGYQGRSLKFEAENGTIIREQTIVAGKRGYQVLVVTPNISPPGDRGEFNEMRATKFLNSFRLLEVEQKKSNP